MYVSTKDILLNYMAEHTKDFSPKQLECFSANNISEKIGISRNLASQYLNELVKEDKLLKINSRPVYFLHKRVIEGTYEVSLKHNVFQSMEDLSDELNKGKRNLKNFQKAIGYNSGIAYCVEQCKAAMKYPPNGLPVLLAGESGTGKSFLARLMYEYAVDEGIIKEQCPFISVNCSEYKSNSKLEIINLFGCKKNILSNAENDHKGIIQNADGGFLVLEEVDCLSVECQEKLLIFMEKGIYCMVGETNSWHKANVKIIFTTTKDPNEALMRAFLRRIPIIIKLPPLAERSIEEKKEMIIEFFKKEAKRIDCEILISDKVFKTLMDFSFTGNIGQLKNCICTGCANAFLHNNMKQHVLKIYLYHLPEYIFPSTKVNTKLDFQEEKNMINLYGITSQNIVDKITDFYDSIVNNFEDYENNEIDFNKMIEIQTANLNSYYDYFMSEKQYTNTKIKTIQKTMERIFDFISEKYNIQISSNCSYVMSKSIYAQMQATPEIEAWETGRSKQIDKFIDVISEKFTKEFMVAKETVYLIKQSIDISLNNIGLIICFLNIKYYNTKSENSDYSIQGVILCHGYSTASSIAATVNSIIGKYIFESIDMPIDKGSSGEIVKRLKKFIKKVNMVRDFILLVDMGSLEEIENELNDIPNINIGIIDNVSTCLALEVGLKMLQGIDMKNILKSVCENTVPKYKIVANERKEEAIVFTSETNTNTSEKMCELFIESLPKSIPIKIISYDYFKLIQNNKEDSIFNKYHVLTIIGTSNPNIQDIPFLALEDIISLKEISKINTFLIRYFSQEEIQQFNRNILKNFSLQNVMQYLTILNADKLLDYVEEVVNHLQQLMGKKLSGATILGIYVHLSCLVERLVTKNQIETHMDLDEFKANHQLFIKQMNESFNVIENNYGVKIPISEIAYIYDYISNDENNDN